MYKRLYMAKNFEKELPEGYEISKVIDASDKKLGLILNMVAVLVSIGLSLLAYYIIKPSDIENNFNMYRGFIYIAVLLLYIVLHEVVHGIAYKVLTKEKLTFGMTFSVAFCGVPNIFVYRKTALIALLSPFVLFSVIFGVLILVIPNPWDSFFMSIIFAFHIGGCSGDLYDTYLYLFKFKSPDTLMQDTGPKQTFYVKTNS